MRLTWLPDATPRARHIAVGEFDGVHLGHREVIRGADTVLTFEPHPQAVVAPGRAPLRLTPLAVKRDLMADLGVEELVVIPFDEAFARRDAQAFIDDVLIAGLGARTVSVGANFHFGHRARGDVELLRRQRAFTTRVVPLVSLDGIPVSSSQIRESLQAGDVARANAALGYPFELRGIVAHGERRGRALGYPTANLGPQEGAALPAHGIYACRAGVRGGGAWEWHSAAVSVGVRPTFVTALGVLVEAFLVDFDGDLYGREMRLRFIERLRGEVRYEGVDALIDQMNRDVEDVRAVDARAARDAGSGDLA
jgi:riboflavin kinase/FMN adenylyltransferase